MLLKVHPTEDAMRRLTRGADQKTIRKWTRQFVTAVTGLEPFPASSLLFCCCMHASATLMSCLLADLLGKSKERGHWK